MTRPRTKHLMPALAILLAAAAAHAQSTLTLFGIVDAAVAWGHGSGAGSTSQLLLANSGYSTSRLGFRGREDLGGGLAAAFWLEAGLNNDTGTGAPSNTNNQSNGFTGAGALTFNRRSTVSIMGRFGEIRLGRDFTPQFWNLTDFDPFGTAGVGMGQTYVGTGALVGPTAVRASNGFGYFLPANLGGFYGQVQYYLGENAGNAPNHDDGTGAGIRVGYASGAVNVAVATSATRYRAGLVRQSNIGGQWNLSSLSLLAHYASDRNGAARGSGWEIGTLVPVGPGQIRAAYSRYAVDPGTGGADPRASKWALGYVHNLSKRTALYATYAYVSNANGAAVALNSSLTAPDHGSSGADIGIRHVF